jgi:hypothetical protein
MVNVTPSHTSCDSDTCFSPIEKVEFRPGVVDMSVLLQSLSSSPHFDFENELARFLDPTLPIRTFIQGCSGSMEMSFDQNRIYEWSTYFELAFILLQLCLVLKWPADSTGPTRYFSSSFIQHTILPDKESYS